MEINELLRVRDRKSSQEDGIHYAEDSCVGPHAQCDRQNGNSREDRRFCQLAEGVTKALCKSKHGVPPRPRASSPGHRSRLPTRARSKGTFAFSWTYAAIVELHRGQTVRIWRAMSEHGRAIVGLQAPTEHGRS